MIGTNRDLSAMRAAVEYEISKLKMLRTAEGRRADVDYIDRQLISLSRERLVLSAAIVSRQAEAAKDVVAFARWVSGDGALDRVTLLRAEGRLNAQRSRQHSTSGRL